MTALIPGWEFDVTAAVCLAIGAAVALVWFAHALHETRGVTLRRLWRDWAETGERRQ